jgi:hypothetical protein
MGPELCPTPKNANGDCFMILGGGGKRRRTKEEEALWAKPLSRFEGRNRIQRRGEMKGRLTKRKLCGAFPITLHNPRESHASYLQ